MAHLIRVGDKYLVGGVNWVRTDFIESAAGKKGAKKGGDTDAAKAKALGAVMIAGPAEWNTKGFLTADDKRSLGKIPLGKKLFAVSEVFANMQGVSAGSACMLVLQLPDDPDNTFMCVVVNGVPFPGYDEIVPNADVGKRVHEWDFAISDSTQGAKVTMWGSYSADHDLTWEDLLTDSTGYLPMRSVAGNQKLLQYLVIAGVVGYGLYFGYGKYRQYEARKAAAIAAAKRDPNVVYAAALTKEWAQMQWGDRIRLLGVAEFATSAPTRIAGFDLKDDITCDVKVGQCTYRYVRPASVLVTYEGFAADAESKRFATVVYGLDGKTIIATANAKNLPVSVKPANATLPAEGTIPVAFWSRLQEMPSDLVKASLQQNWKLFPNNAGVAETTVKSKVRTVGFKIDGALFGLGELPPNASVFADAINYSLLTVHVRPKDTTVSIEGEIYVRKNGS